FDTLADFAPMTNDVELLAEYVRQSLAVQITKQYVGEGNTLSVMTIAPDVEQLISTNIQQTEHGSYLALEHNIQESIIRNVVSEYERIAHKLYQIVILCSPTI